MYTNEDNHVGKPTWKIIYQEKMKQKKIERSVRLKRKAFGKQNEWQPVAERKHS